jgi:hypothetical protein
VYVNCPIFEEFTHENAEALRLFFWRDLS